MFILDENRSFKIHFIAHNKFKFEAINHAHHKNDFYNKLFCEATYKNSKTTINIISAEPELRDDEDDEDDEDDKDDEYEGIHFNDIGNTIIANELDDSNVQLVITHINCHTLENNFNYVMTIRDNSNFNGDDGDDGDGDDGDDDGDGKLYGGKSKSILLQIQKNLFDLLKTVPTTKHQHIMQQFLQRYPDFKIK